MVSLVVLAVVVPNLKITSATYAGSSGGNYGGSSAGGGGGKYVGSYASDTLKNSYNTQDVRINVSVY